MLDRIHSKGTLTDSLSWAFRPSVLVKSTSVCLIHDKISVLFVAVSVSEVLTPSFDCVINGHQHSGYGNSGGRNNSPSPPGITV
jgi:hypothetical protein